MRIREHLTAHARVLFWDAVTRAALWYLRHEMAHFSAKMAAFVPSAGGRAPSAADVEPVLAEYEQARSRERVN